MIKPILVLGQSRLNKKTHKVRPYQDVSGLVRDLRDTMEKYEGIGIAANQIGSLYSVMIANDRVYINPEIIKVSEDWIIGTEGCLSIPDYVADVWRHGAVLIKAENERRHPFKIKLHDWEARVVQHEISHCNGRLIIDEPHENFGKEDKNG